MAGFLNSTISVSTKALSKLPRFGKEFTLGYQFCLSIRSLVKHPVIFDHEANTDRLRHLLCLSHKKYQSLLKIAYKHGLIENHGNNLHIISRTKERKIFNLRKSADYQTIDVKDLKSFTYAQIVIKKAKTQEYLIKKKHIATTLKGERLSAIVSQDGISNQINSHPNLSLRTLGEILEVSHTTASKILTDIQRFGLVVNKNTMLITEKLFVSLLSTGSHNIRYDKESREHYFIGANLVSLDKKVVNNAYYVRTSLSYCDM